jgi:dTDP-4-amino-4,6-dideoxygalactose transaminase
MLIPFMNLKESLKVTKQEILSKLDYLIENSQFIGGQEVELFEQEFAEYCNANYAVGCSNGTDAIVIALKALGIGPGDTVIVPVNTFIATSEAVTMAGANVEFIDVDEFTYTMDLSLLSEFLEKNQARRIKAVIPVHLYGQMVNMPELKKITDTYGIKIIEDSAQAHGATCQGLCPGHLSDIATFSFYPGKNLGAFGDAGAIITNNSELFQKCKMLTDHGRWKQKYEHAIEGYNKRLDTLQAAILRIKLKHLDNWVAKRREKANKYILNLKDKANVILPNIAYGNEPAWHLFVIRVNERDKVRSRLKELNIDTGVHYPIPLHLQPAYRYRGYENGSFKVAEQLATQIVSLPLWPEMTDQQLEYVCNSLIKVV